PRRRRTGRSSREIAAHARKTAGRRCATAFGAGAGRTATGGAGSGGPVSFPRAAGCAIPTSGRRRRARGAGRAGRPGTLKARAATAAWFLLPRLLRLLPECPHQRELHPIV